MITLTRYESFKLNIITVLTLNNKTMTLVERLICNTGAVTCRYSFGKVIITDGNIIIRHPKYNDLIATIHTEQCDPTFVWQLASGIEEAAEAALENYVESLKCKVVILQNLLEKN